MISIAITSFKEPKTIGRAIDSILNQNLKDYELIVSSPDKKTQKVVEKYMQKNKNILLIKDKGLGKPTALNLIFKKAHGEILILTDGDVYANKDSIKYLLEAINNSKEIGAVTARVISTNPKDSLFGFWAYLLTESFHIMRLNEQKRAKNVICSGYLYALRTGIIYSLPEDVLADDAYISFMIQKRGFRTLYEPKAEVYVKYPTNLPDWIRQKKRTAARFYQLKKIFKISKTASLSEEARSTLWIFTKLKNFKELFWFLFLILMKSYIWARVFLDIRLWRRSFKNNWERVESTK